LINDVLSFMRKSLTIQKPLSALALLAVSDKHFGFHFILFCNIRYRKIAELRDATTIQSFTGRDTAFPIDSLRYRPGCVSVGKQTVHDIQYHVPQPHRSMTDCRIFHPSGLVHARNLMKPLSHWIRVMRVDPVALPVLVFDPLWFDRSLRRSE
jgi:hypothetical protein